MEWVILACGPSLRQYQKEIQEYIQPTMITVGVNNIGGLFVPDYHVFVNRQRHKKYGGTVSPKSKLVLGYKFKGPCDYVLQFENEYPSSNGHMSLDGERIVCGGATVAYLAAGFAIMMGAKRITFAGLDGATKGYHYYEGREATAGKLEMLEAASHGILRDINKLVPVKILTPTVYEEYYAGFTGSV